MLLFGQLRMLPPKISCMNKLSIALVDDHVMLRNGLASLINDMNGFNVVLEADNGKVFIETLMQEKIVPDIVLLDINMPVMDGFTTAAWINENLPAAKTLVLSMFDDEQSIIKMLRLGAKGYVLKDGEPTELANALHDVSTKGYHYTDLVNGKLVHAINYMPNGVEVKKDKLTERETEFLKRCCSEMTYKEIAQIMCLSVRTVEGYRDQLFLKLDIKTRVGLVMYAIKNKMVIL
jgi:two-component system, NarL family, invasion response regulator UvrY